MHHGIFIIPEGTLCKVISLIFLLGPLCFMLFTAKTFIIVSLHLEELLEVNFAVNDTLKCCICAHTEGEIEKVTI